MCAFLLVGDILGAGVLELGGNLRAFGWGFGMFFLTCFFPLNLYTGHLLARLGAAYPNAVTYGELATSIFPDKKYVGRTVYAAVYFNLSLALGSYLLTIAKTIEGIFYSASWCTPVSSLVAVLCLLIPIQARTMRGVSYQTMVGFATIVIVVAWCLLEPIADGETVHPTSAVTSDLTFWQAMRSLSGFVFAYAGPVNIRTLCENLGLEKHEKHLTNACGASFNITSSTP